MLVLKGMLRRGISFRYFWSENSFEFQLKRETELLSVFPRSDALPSCSYSLHRMKHQNSRKEDMYFILVKGNFRQKFFFDNFKIFPNFKINKVLLVSCPRWSN